MPTCTWLATVRIKGRSWSTWSGGLLSSEKLLLQEALEPSYSTVAHRQGPSVWSVQAAVARLHMPQCSVKLGRHYGIWTCELPKPSVMAARNHQGPPGTPGNHLKERGWELQQRSSQPATQTESNPQVAQQPLAGGSLCLHITWACCRPAVAVLNRSQQEPIWRSSPAPAVATLWCETAEPLYEAHAACWHVEVVLT